MTKASGTTSSRAQRTPAAGRPRFPIVGVVASAGGLEAFTKLLQAMPADTGMALVLIPHLDPSHSSMMAELLGRHTPMPVAEATDGRRVEPDHVYVIPPNADLVVRDGVLRVVTAAHAPGRTAIDSFLESLAADQQEWSAGIVLSGTGNHGAQGVRAVKAAGGVVFAQAPDSAAQAQMPRAAIATGVVDEVLPPEQMPPALVRHLRAPAPPSLAATDLGAVLTVLRLQLKRDFRGYRTPMLSRRIHRRMALHGSASIADYAEFLRADPQEVRALVRDLSIGVTAFFREPDAFHALERVAIPDLIAQRRRASDGERPVRVWVPGCSTGEEAYSLGMLLFEQLAAAGLPTHLQIFATDADAAALEVAREGRYSDTAVAGLSPERLRQFFVRVDEHRYQVSPALREAVTFAEQNLVSDAPFSRLDLISCRNVLIYLEPDVQAKVIALFHFALNEGGYLMLGPAESVSSPAGRFEPLSKRWRVYRRIGNGRPLVDIPILPVAGFQTGRTRAADTARPKAYGELLHRALLSDYAPAAALVNRRLEILSIQGPLGDFIEFPPGEWTRDLLSLARPGLRAAIRAVCHDALEERRAAAGRRARVKRGGAYVACTVSARPVGASSELDALAAVTFQDGGGTRASAPATPVRVAAGAGVVAQLQAELLGTREELQGTIDELQAANEELKGSHEELLSVNEELQSTNEELETSKEELQSLNEELNTVNSQLQEKVRELDAANNDLVNLLASTEIASVFLDAALLIKRFTTPALTLFNLLPSDLGRPFSDIRPHFQDAALLDDCREVLARLVPSEAMVQGPAGQAYLRRVLPYRTADRRIDGVVILWFDITPRLAAEAGARHLRAVLADTQDAIALVSLDGRVTSWNRAAERLYGYTEAEACARALSDLTAPSGQEAVTASFRRIATGQTPSESASTVRLTKDGRTRDVWATMTALRDSTGQPVTVLLTEQDVTVIIEGRLAKDTVTLYERLVDRLPVGAVLRSDGQVSLNRAAEALTGYTRTELTTAEAWFRLLHADEPGARERYEAGATGRAEVMTFVRKDGVARTMGLTVTPIDATRALWTFIDATESLQSEAALRESGDYLRSVIDTVADAVITINEHGTIDVFNPAAERLFGYRAADAIGMNLRELMPSPHREAHEDYVSRYLATRVPHIIGTSTEITARHKDGTLFPAQLTVGEIDHRRRFVGVLHDLRGRRALEWRLADSQIEERRHMARELHDEIGGHMTGIGLLAQSLHTELAAAHSPLAAQAREVIETIALAHQRLRAVIRGLMPVDTVPNGLTIALGELVAQSQSISGVMCRLQADSPAPVDDPETALHLYRIVQEALNNALRHAHATAVVVTLSRSGDRIEIAVSDDGQGLKAPTAHDGIGLKAMQQRARLLGGECVIEPRPGGGTTVRCWAPTGGGRRVLAAAPTSPGRGPR